VIHEVDSALRALIERETGIRDVEVVFDAPTRDWAGRRTVPTIDVYLYDIREDLRRRERGVLNEYNDDETRIIGRHLPPRHFKLSYLVTAWTQRPEDEHRLLSALLSAFLKFDALPAELLDGPLADLHLPVPLTVGLPPPEDRGFADVWSALGGELKPSIDVVVSAPISTGQQFPLGPPVTEPPLFSFGGSAGWPGTEPMSVDFTVEAPPADAAAPSAATGATAGPVTEVREGADEGEPAAGRLSAGQFRAGKPAQTIRGGASAVASGAAAGAPPVAAEGSELEVRSDAGVGSGATVGSGAAVGSGDNPYRVSMRRRRLTLKQKP
jgi:hypothetical protein